MNILLVEDYVDLQQVLRESLQRPGHAVTALGSAEEVDATLATQRGHLALIDLNLPGEDGLSLVRRLRQAYPEMGIVVISARNTTLDRVNGYQSGADLYLNKPIVHEELYSAIAAVARRLTLPAQPLVLPDERQIELDSSSLEVRGPQGSARLTTTEYALLAGLSRAKDRILDTPLIYQMLGRTEGRKSALEALVYRVRRKMAQAGAGDNAIRAHRLKGYQLFCPVRIV